MVMNRIVVVLNMVALTTLFCAFSFKREKNEIEFVEEVDLKTLKPLVNYDYFKNLVKEVETHRKEHLVSLSEFKKMAQEDGTIILDARSEKMFLKRHVKGAVNLDFSDFSQESLDEILLNRKGRDTKILIYCNNNFYDSKAVRANFQAEAMVSKVALPSSLTEVKVADVFLNEKSLALNIPTYINLYGYDYENVYELNEMVDVSDSILSFEGSLH